MDNILDKRDSQFQSPEVVACLAHAKKEADVDGSMDLSEHGREKQKN